MKLDKLKYNTPEEYNLRTIKENLWRHTIGFVLPIAFVDSRNILQEKAALRFVYDAVVAEYLLHYPQHEPIGYNKFIACIVSEKQKSTGRLHYHLLVSDFVKNTCTTPKDNCKLIASALLKKQFQGCDLNEREIDVQSYRSESPLNGNYRGYIFKETNSPYNSAYLHKLISTRNRFGANAQIIPDDILNVCEFATDRIKIHQTKMKAKSDGVFYKRFEQMYNEEEVV